MMTHYTVKHHKGHSGKSVYEWRVYATYEGPIRSQLGKFRTEASAREFLRRLVEAELLSRQRELDRKRPAFARSSDALR
jgi:hypothetical protein